MSPVSPAAWLSFAILCWTIIEENTFLEAKPTYNLLCRNISTPFHQAVLYNLSLDNTNVSGRHIHTSLGTLFNDSSVNGKLRDKDRHALLYIVVVLLFYSTGIVIGIITYLKREKEDIEEDKSYDDYMNFRNDPDKWTRYFGVQRMITHLNRVEAEADERRRENQREQEELLKSRLAESKKKTWLFGHDRRLSKAPKKRFSFAESAVHSMVREQPDKKKERRRWSLKPAWHFSKHGTKHQNQHLSGQHIGSSDTIPAIEPVEVTAHCHGCQCQPSPSPVSSLRVHSAAASVYHTRSMTELPMAHTMVAMTDV